MAIELRFWVISAKFGSVFSSFDSTPFSAVLVENRSFRLLLWLQNITSTSWCHNKWKTTFSNIAHHTTTLNLVYQYKLIKQIQCSYVMHNVRKCSFSHFWDLKSTHRCATTLNPLRNFLDQCFWKICRASMNAHALQPFKRCSCLAIL